MAVFAPQLTLDFLQQVCLDIDKVPCVQKALCLQYASPWIKNLDKFCDPASKQFEPSGVKLRDCIKALLDLTVKDPDVGFLLWVLIIDNLIAFIISFALSPCNTYGQKLGRVVLH